LLRLFQQHNDIISNNRYDIGILPRTQMTIKLKNNTVPFTSKPYRLPTEQANDIKKQIKELLEYNFISKSKSEWASPCFVVPKPDKTYRMCIDYRELNNQTIKDKYSIPYLQDLVQKFYVFTVSSTID